MTSHWGNAIFSIPNTNSACLCLRADTAPQPPLNYRDTRGHCKPGGPRTPSNTTNANFDSVFVKNAPIYTDP